MNLEKIEKLITEAFENKDKVNSSDKALNKLVSERKIDKEEKILLMNTGSVFKYFELM